MPVSGDRDDKTDIIHLNILGLWIFMSKGAIKLLRIHGSQSTSQLMNPILEGLNYFLTRLFSTSKSIQIIH